jgi:uncharacterized Fe-S center protein
MSVVYFSAMRNKNTVSPLNKIKKLMNRCGAKDIYSKGDLVAVKVHFGEYGNTAFIRPIYLRPVIEQLKAYNAKPYLTDTNTLYVGMRTNSVDHILNANFNGFGFSTLQVPIIIADGLRGENVSEMPVPNGKHLKTAKLASDIVNADAMVLVSHFKGHEVTGFGGAIKNLAMGCAARGGKLAMHSVSKPKIKTEKCTACGRCKSVCQAQAISISGHATIGDKCTGCARCIGICPEGIISIRWDNGLTEIQEMISEYASAVMASFDKPVICINILTSMVAACDCMAGNDAPVVHDLGFLASTDPVALDQASYDLVKRASEGKDPFAVHNNGITGEIQLKHAEAIGFGSTKYDLVNID